MAEEPILSLQEVCVSYALPRRFVWSRRESLTVLKDISFDVAAGTSLGIVGESGSGKTTLGRTILRLLTPQSGRILFENNNIASLSESQLREHRAHLQMIFQDPQSSLNPRKKIGTLVTQPLLAFNRIERGAERARRAAELLEMVDLDHQFVHRYPHELSGGQRQRVGIARALALKPRLVVADEIVSGLDVSSQARILKLLLSLRKQLRLTLVFISHDLSVVRALCDRTLVMQHGKIAELNDTDELFNFPRHAYTRELIRAIPLPQIDEQWIKQPVDTLSKGGLAMQVKGATALVTGANRGIGKAIVNELLTRGAKKVYAAARNPDSVVTGSHNNVEVIALDITDHTAIQAVANKLSDVDLLVNNAGINRMSAFAASDDVSSAREEMEVNYFGTMAMCKAFAPVLKANGGGAIVNLLSILARVNLPLMGSLCASKAAGLSMVQGLRAELAAQHTAVVAVMPGAVDTDMSKDFPPPKMPAAEVATAMLDGLEQGLEEIYPGDMASGLNQGLSADPKAVEKELAGYLPG
ncbi:MAG: SDR family oxidoreductase [Granulosicoccus sp.]|nr:SDR family oxidoreductase [Granulosicoccus sp.]